MVFQPGNAKKKVKGKDGIDLFREALRRKKYDDFEDLLREKVKGEYHLGLRDFAKSAGMTRQTLHRFLSGRGSLSLANLSSILRQLGWAISLEEAGEDPGA
jgi:DNA-binding phage protein